MTFTEDKLKIQEIEALAREHYKEVGSIDAPFNPNWDIFKQLDEAGLLRSFIARVDGVVVGYNYFMLTPDMWHKDMVNASEIAIFMHPDHRGNGVEFIKFVDSQLKCSIIYRSIKVLHDYSLVLARQGYHLVDKVYMKRK